MWLKKNRAPVDSERGAEITTVLSLISLNPVTLAHINGNTHLCYLCSNPAPHHGLSLTCLTVWHRKSKFYSPSISYGLAAARSVSCWPPIINSRRRRVEKVSGLRWMMVVFCEEGNAWLFRVTSPPPLYHRPFSHQDYLQSWVSTSQLNIYQFYPDYR